MNVYTIKDTTTNSIVAVIDDKEMPLEAAFDVLRNENKELQRQLDVATECVEMFIKACGSCALCAKLDCKLRDQHRTRTSACSPIWSGHMDATAE